MSLVSVSNSFANNLVGLFFLLVVHYATQAQQGMWYKMAEGGPAGYPPFLVPGWWPPPFEELVVHASQSFFSPWGAEISAPGKSPVVRFDIPLVADVRRM